MNIIKIIDGWDKKLNLALKTGRGKFGGHTPIGDIFDYKKIIEAIRNGQLCKAFDLANDLDTIARDEIPMTVWNILEKEYYK